MKGFHIIELVIVLAIIGVLASIAIPGYCNYIVPAKVSAALVSTKPLKNAIVQYYQKHKVMPPTATLSVNLTAHNLDYLESVHYNRYGADSAAIIYRFNEKLTGILDTEKANHKTIIFRVTADANTKLLWDCHGGDLPEQYRPRACKLDYANKS